MGLRSWAARGVLALSGALLLGLGSPEAINAQRTLTIEDFSVRLEVAQDGTMEVMEAIRFRFDGSWNGVYRDIPVNYETPTGLNFKLFLSDFDVRDDSGAELRFERSREGHYQRIKTWVPGANNTTKTVTFRYSVENPLRYIDGEGEGFADGYDELYWNATGSEWDIPIERATVMVDLPPGLTGKQAKVYTGRYGATGSDATIQETESGFYFESTRPFQPREGLTVDLAWDPGVIARPSSLKKASRVVRSNILLLLPFLSFWFMWRHWKEHGKDPERGSIAPQYGPPEGLTPSEIGTLVDGTPDMRDITAAIVDLAVRGYIKIEQQEETTLGIFKSEEFVFHKVKDRSEWKKLTEFERTLLRELFQRGVGDSVSTEDLENDFYSEIGRLKEILYDQMIEHDFYKKRPDHVVLKYVGAGAVALFVGIFGGAVLSAEFGLSAFSAIVAAVGSALPFFIFGPLMSRRTKLGARQQAHILGFQEFLNRVEADHFKRMIEGPEMFEKFLPHAMALGVEKRWAKAFEDMYTEPPDWYVGHHGRFHCVGFTRSMNSMSTRTGSMMSSQPRSSGGSGFSSGGGGGFSGGGFGGGGGGGF